jgi:DNA ligase-1
MNEWEVQQAQNYSDVKIPEGEWFCLTEKINGVRGTIFDKKVISRQGREFAGLDHILKDLQHLVHPHKLSDYVFDGELVRRNINPTVSNNANFRMGAGLVRQADADKSSIIYIIFDVMPRNDFVQGESTLTYKHRLEHLKHYQSLLDKFPWTNSVQVVDILYEGTNQMRIRPCLMLMDDKDKEGLILNRDTKYYRKRHSGILKIKSFNTIDLCITGWEEGKGRLEGTLGAFTVDYKGYALSVGSGMTDRQRSEFWEQRNLLVGRVIEVMYKEETENKQTDRKSLQFPIFIALREEGKEVSYN